MGSGIYEALNLQPGQDPDAGNLGPGCWCLWTASTVPWVRIECAGRSRVITWGEVFEIPPNQFGKIRNASAHAGDVLLAPVFDRVAAPRPAQLSLPVLWDPIPLQAGVAASSQWLDVRTARRAYLVLDSPAPLPVPFTIEHNFANLTPEGLAYGRTASNVGQGQNNNGTVGETRAVSPVSGKISLGLRTLDTAVFDPYPHMLFSRVRLTFQDGGAAIGALDAFYQVEY
jgi:hypothetical protein